MNEFESLINVIRNPSAGSLRGLPSPKRYRARGAFDDFIGPRPPDRGPARFDDFATDCTVNGLAWVAVTSNASLPANVWRPSNMMDELNSIYRTALHGTTYNGARFTDTLAKNRRRLFVAIVEIDPTAEDSVLVPRGRGFDLVARVFSCVGLKVLVAASPNGANLALKLPVFRWNICKRKFSLPKGRRPAGTNYVRGPYLAVGVVEPESGAIAKVRLWPVWLSMGTNRMSVVRSDIERGSAAAISDTGAVGFTLINRRHMLLLSRGLAHRWRGDLLTYPYQPDGILMPVLGAKVTVLEILGLRSLKRYDAGAAVKIEVGASCREINFKHLSGRLTPLEVYHWTQDLVQADVNGVWSPPAQAVA